MKSWVKAPWLSAPEAKAEIDRLIDAISNESDPRNRAKTARRLAFAGISLAFVDEDLPIEDLERGIATLAQVFCIRNRGRARIILVACPAEGPPPPLTQLPQVEF